MMSDCGCQIELKDQKQKKVLITLLVINAVMFVLELAFGLLAQSTALIADSLDMLADASVYGISLYAVGRASIYKKRAASLSGIAQILLGLLVIVDVVRRYIVGSEPDSLFMLMVGSVALLANVICLRLIAAHKDDEVHMRASWIFSRNDVIANLGTIIAGIMVFYLQTRLPDLLIGALIAVLVIRGGVSILKDAASE